MKNDLAEVKKETAGIMAEEAETKRLMDENQAEMDRYENLEAKALQAGNEEDVRVFLEKKQELGPNGPEGPAMPSAAWRKRRIGCWRRPTP